MSDTLYLMYLILISLQLINIILPNSIIIISLLVSVIYVCSATSFPPPTSFNSYSSYPPTITSHTQCGDIVTAVSECWYLPVTDSGRGICR